MAANFILPGARSWSMVQDQDGHRDYKLSVRIKCDPLNGPALALSTPGLPVFGSWWIVDNDVDLWAWRRWPVSVNPVLTGEPNTYFDLEFLFSTKPPDNKRRVCTDNPVQDPLLEPMKVSGSFLKYQEEAAFDEFGLPIINSAYERIHGPQNEWDNGRLTVKIEQNVASLELPLLSAMKDTLNDRPLWGMPPRCIKFVPTGWERKFYGTCYPYYTRSLEFEVRPPGDGIMSPVGGFDRFILDEGTKVLHGHWNPNTGNWVLDSVGTDGGGAPIMPDFLNPAHFSRFTDRAGNACKVILNGFGVPADVTEGSGPGTFATGSPGKRYIQKYSESNLLLLGIPPVIGN